MKVNSSESKRDKIPNNAQTVFSLKLPYAVPVPDGIYKVKVGKHTTEIAIRRVQRAQIDGWQASKGTFVQLAFDKYGRSSFSFIQIKIPWVCDLPERGRTPLLLGDVPPRTKSKEIALRFLNRFIETVRYVTEEYWIEPARYQDVLSFEMFYWDGKEKYPAALSLLDSGVGGIAMGTGHPFQMKTEKLDELKNYLENESELEASKIFLLNSKDACLQEDFRLAIIETVTALEIVLYRFIRRQGEKLGIPQSELNNFIIDVGLKGNLSVVLKMLTKGLEQIDDEIINRCKGAISIRNKILHEGLMEVSSTDTEERIIAIENMITYLYRIMP